MKKLIVIAAVLALALGAYPGATWYFGRQLETVLDARYRELEGNPMVKVRERTFERGVYTSTDTVTLEVMGEFLAAALAVEEMAFRGEPIIGRDSADGYQREQVINMAGWARAC